MIAALYVPKGGCYFGLPDVDPWDESRDARNYDGPHAVVAHPPCARWGRFAVRAFGKEIGAVGDDAGCFDHVLASVRKYGGVLEHPASSKAWAIFGIARPPSGGGWVPAGDGVGYTCQVDQGHYGHRMRKPTWLYVAALAPPPLICGASLPDGYVSAPHGTMGHGSTYNSLSRRMRAATPLPFRDVLLAMARSVPQPKEST